MSREITIADLEASLRINEHALEEAAAQQPSLFYFVSRELVRAISQRDAAKQTLQEIEAVVDAKIRSDAETAGEKITEKEVDSHKTLNKEVRNARKELLRLTTQASQWAALKESFQQRSYALTHMVELFIHNFYGSDPVARAENKAKTLLADKAKQALANARRKQGDC